MGIGSNLITYYLQYCFINIAAGGLALLPWRWIVAITRFASDRVFSFYASRRKVALKNLDRTYGNALSEDEKWSIARNSFRNTALSFVDLLLIKKTLAHAERDFKLTGLENLEQAFAREKGVILVISHLGSWEYLAMLPYLTHRRWSVVVKKIKNPFLDKKLDSLRGLTRLNPVPKKGSIRAILQELRNNDGIAILIDQWAGPEGVWQDFFGHATSTTTIPARLAKRTECALLPAYCIRLGKRKFEIQLHNAFDPEEIKALSESEITKKLNHWLEKQILKYPEQWFWAHKRWKSRPSVLRDSS